MQKKSNTKSQSTKDSAEKKQPRKRKQKKYLIEQYSVIVDNEHLSDARVNQCLKTGELVTDIDKHRKGLKKLFAFLLNKDEEKITINMIYKEC